MQIAYYLGISHEFLSKIRRKIVSKNSFIELVQCFEVGNDHIFVPSLNTNKMKLMVFLAIQAENMN